MTRIFLIALQAGALAFSLLAVAALAAPLSPEGLVAMPSRIAGGLFLFARMPLQGVSFLNVLPNLFWVPVITAAAAFPEGIKALRPVRWVGVAVNLAALLYLYYMFPGLGAPETMPTPLLAVAALFAGNTFLLALLPGKSNTTAARRMTGFLLFLFWAGSVALLVYAAFRQHALASAWSGIAAYCTGYTAGFYCLCKAVAFMEKKKGARGEPFVLAALALSGIAAFFSLPAALPLLGGLIIYIAVRAI